MPDTSATVFVRPAVYWKLVWLAGFVLIGFLSLTYEPSEIPRTAKEFVADLIIPFVPWVAALTALILAYELIVHRSSRIYLSRTGITVQRYCEDEIPWSRIETICLHRSGTYLATHYQLFLSLDAGSAKLLKTARWQIRRVRATDKGFILIKPLDVDMPFLRFAEILRAYAERHRPEALHEAQFFAIDVIGRPRPPKPHTSRRALSPFSPGPRK